MELQHQEAPHPLGGEVTELSVPGGGGEEASSEANWLEAQAPGTHPRQPLGLQAPQPRKDRTPLRVGGGVRPQNSKARGGQWGQLGVRGRALEQDGLGLRQGSRWRGHSPGPLLPVCTLFPLRKHPLFTSPAPRAGMSLPIHLWPLPLEGSPAQVSPTKGGF